VVGGGNDDSDAMEKVGGGKKKRAEIIFSQLWFLISPLSGHEFHPYL
jgi:hypothetical protein